MSIQKTNVNKGIKMSRIMKWLLCFLLPSFIVFAEHNHQAMMKPVIENSCQQVNIACAKTVTSAFSPKGELWRLWSYKSHLYYEISIDGGMSFSSINRVAIPAEKISSRNENRPKIAFDKYDGVYLSWATPKEKKYTADVRFSYSADHGKTFTLPITVNNDNLLTGHSFNELLVTVNGEINIVWLDARHSYQLRKTGKKSNGSALYFAKANFRAGQYVFTNQKLATGTCVCCRIAMDYNAEGSLAILWRHIYGDNIREFALLTLKEGSNQQENPYQISHDHWKINGCPHQGGGISIDENNIYHMVWFNQGDKGKGIFYASSKDQGKTLTKSLSVGQQSAQASHPHVHKNGAVVDIVWTEFNGIEHQLWHQRSKDHGKSFAVAKILATAKGGADRPFIISYKNKSFVSWHKVKTEHWLAEL